MTVPEEIAPGITLRLLDAGHVLGSAVVVLDIEDDGTTTRLGFSGDLGRTYGMLGLAALAAAVLAFITYRARSLKPASTAEMLGPSR